MFLSFLTNRSKFVYYGGRQSEIQSITYGVPQCSIIGPLLFIVYMNDICNVSELLFTVLYADDTSVVIHGKDMLIIITTLNQELHLLSTWLKANKLSLNTDKTYYMIFHRAGIKLADTDYPIIINNYSLSNFKNHKYLGVILDSKMSWIQHIAYVKNKVAKCHLDQLYILHTKKWLGLLLFRIIIKLYVCLLNIYLENSRSYHYIISYKTE